jgi:hypothetical protein
VTLWDPATGQELLSLRDVGSKVCFDPQGQLLITVHWGFSRLIMWGATEQPAP